MQRENWSKDESVSKKWKAMLLEVKLDSIRTSWPKWAAMMKRIKISQRSDSSKKLHSNRTLRGTSQHWKCKRLFWKWIQMRKIIHRGQKKFKKEADSILSYIIRGKKQALIQQCLNFFQRNKNTLILNFQVF